MVINAAIKASDGLFTTKLNFQANRTASHERFSSRKYLQAAINYLRLVRLARH